MPRPFFLGAAPSMLVPVATLGLCAALLCRGAMTYAEDPEKPTTTPLSEFAPEVVTSNSGGAAYDRGVQIYRIDIRGNRLVSQQTILSAMTLQPGSLYSRNDLIKDLKRIHDLGYFTEDVKATPIATSQGIVLQITVNENTPVTNIEPVGNEALPSHEIVSMFKKQAGMPQNLQFLNESIAATEKLYHDKGFILARVEQVVDRPDGKLEVKVQEGRIDKIQFVGNRKTKDHVIKREMLLKEGDVYNEKVLMDDLQRIFSSQAFSDVRRVLTVSPDHPDRYNLTIELDEKRTAAISLGGGVDTATGFFGSLGYTDPNFRGMGENVSGLFSIGSGVLLRDNRTQANRQIYQVELNWSTPSINETDNALSVGGFGRFTPSFNVPLAVERRWGAETTWSRPINRLPNTSFALTLRGEHVALGEGDLTRLQELYAVSTAQRDAQLTKGTFLSLTPTLAYDTRNNRFDPTEGWFNTIGLTGALGLGGVDSYSALSANVRHYKALTPWLTLALNGQAASSVFADIPDFNAFRLGGTNSVRGYNEGGLGIGSGMLMGSAELRAKVPFLAPFAQKVKFLDSIRVALFADGGTLFNESANNAIFNRIGYGYSIGAGIRMNIPGVGPLRIDYAIPLRGAGSAVRRFSFGVGQKF